MERIDFSLTARKTQERAGRIFAVCAAVRKKRHGRVSVNGAHTAKVRQKPYDKNRAAKTRRQVCPVMRLSCGCHAAGIWQVCGGRYVLIKRKKPRQGRLYCIKGIIFARGTGDFALSKSTSGSAAKLQCGQTQEVFGLNSLFWITVMRIKSPLSW